MARIGTKVNVQLENTDQVLPSIPHSATDLFWQSQVEELQGTISTIMNANARGGPGPVNKNANGQGSAAGPFISNKIFRTATGKMFAQKAGILRPNVQWVDTIENFIFTINSKKSGSSNPSHKLDSNARFEETSGSDLVINSHAIITQETLFLWKHQFDTVGDLKLVDFTLQGKTYKKIQPFQPFSLRFTIRRSPEKGPSAASVVGTIRDIIKDKNALTAPAVELILKDWGYKVIIHAGNQLKADILELDKDGTYQIIGSLISTSQAQNMVGDKLWTNFIIYPFFNQLYFIFDTTLDENTSNFLAVTPQINKKNEIVTSKETEFSMKMYGGNQVIFQMGFLVYSTAAFFVSAPINTPYNLDLALRNISLKIFYIGKNSARLQGAVKGSGTGLLNKAVKIFGNQTSNDIRSDDIEKAYNEIAKKCEVWKLLIEKGNESAINDLISQSKVDKSEDIEVIEGITKVKDVVKQWQTSNNTRQFRWVILLKTDSVIYTPAVLGADFFSLPDLVTVNGLVEQPIERDDALSLEITQSVQGSVASVELLNRHRGNHRGKYTDAKGIKPIKMDISNAADDTNSSTLADTVKSVRHFRGYVVERTHVKGSNGAYGSVRWNCEDRSYRLKQIRTFNLPIFDGYCHLAAMFYLAKVGGLTDDELVIFQDPNDENNKVTIKQVMEEIGNDNLSFTGPCWEGHVKGFPKSQTINGLKIPGRFLHATLENGFGVSQPYYMAQMGREVWPIMYDIATQTMQFYLYANNHGNIVYQAPEVVFSTKGTDQPADPNPQAVRKDANTVLQTEKKDPEPKLAPTFDFVEVATAPDKYNELKRTYQGTYDSKSVRNCVIAMGLIPLNLNANSKDQVYTPIVAIEKEHGWPFNLDSHSWQPWLNVVFMQNAEWAVEERIKFIAQQTAARLFNRPFLIARWDAWGQSALHPYLLVTVDESKTNEIQQENKNKYIVTSIIHRFDINNLLYECNIEGELYLPQYKWIPPIEDYIEGMINR